MAETRTHVALFLFSRRFLEEKPESLDDLPEWRLSFGFPSLVQPYLPTLSIHVSSRSRTAP